MPSSSTEPGLPPNAQPQRTRDSPPMRSLRSSPAAATPDVLSWGQSRGERGLRARTREGVRVGEREDSGLGREAGPAQPAGQQGLGQLSSLSGETRGDSGVLWQERGCGALLARRARLRRVAGAQTPQGLAHWRSNKGGRTRTR